MPECAGGVASPEFIKSLYYRRHRAWTWPCELDSRCLSCGTCHPNRRIVFPDSRSAIPRCTPRFGLGTALCHARIATKSPKRRNGRTGAAVAAVRASNRASGAHGASGAETCDEGALDVLNDAEEVLSMGPCSVMYESERKQRKKSFFQEQTVCSRAAKATSRMEATLHLDSNSHTVALNASAWSAADRADTSFLSSAAAANSVEGRALQTREMRRRFHDADGRPYYMTDAKAAGYDEEAAFVRQIDAATAAAEPDAQRGNRRGRGRGRSTTIRGVTSEGEK